MLAVVESWVAIWIPFTQCASLSCIETPEPNTHRKESDFFLINAALVDIRKQNIFALIRTNFSKLS